MNLKAYLIEDVGIPEETAQMLDSICDTMQLPRGHQLITAGQNSKKVYFVEKGLMRLYYVKDGKDITHFFFDEKMMHISIENIFLNKQNPYNLELLEKSTIRSIDYEVLAQYVSQNSKMQQLERYLMVSTMKQLSDQLYSVKFQSAQERYNILLENHRNILLRAPLGHIASYLGITQSTLSVIRAQLAK